MQLQEDSNLLFVWWNHSIPGYYIMKHERVVSLSDVYWLIIITNFSQNIWKNLEWKTFHLGIRFVKSLSEIVFSSSWCHFQSELCTTRIRDGYYYQSTSHLPSGRCPRSHQSPLGIFNTDKLLRTVGPCWNATEDTDINVIFVPKVSWRDAGVA